MTNGILIIYKEKGYTSHDVVACVRRIFGQKKVGHTGTLDPAAEGVLPVCLGPSTRVCSLLTDEDKTYEVRMRLGVRTDTQDLTGTVLERSDVLPSAEEVIAAVLGFEGTYEQLTPMYSARKVNGRRLYDLAREGAVVERRTRTVSLSQIEILSVQLPLCSFRVTCSRGTYIRTLCDDIGQRLGCGAAMEYLLRTRVGIFDLEHALKLSALKEAAAAGTAERFVISPDRLFEAYPAVHFEAEAFKGASNGNPVAFSLLREMPPQEVRRVRMYDPAGRFYGIYETDPEKEHCRPVRILTDLSQ